MQLGIEEVILLGNKCDLKEQKVIHLRTAKEVGNCITADPKAVHSQYASEYGIEYIKTSAKTGENIHQVSTFLLIAVAIVTP